MNWQGVEDPRLVGDEVEFWLGLSRLFYEAFHVTKYLGPNWFLVNQLLMGSDETTFSNVASAIRPLAITRSNAALDLSSYLRHLEGAGHISLMLPAAELSEHAALGVDDTLKLDSDHGLTQVANSKRSKKKKLRVIPVATRICLLPKIHTATSKYVHGVVERLLDRREADKARGNSREIMKSIYGFLRTRYVRCWEDFLSALARESNRITSNDVDFVAGQLRANTEIHFILHRLWDSVLIGEDEEGFYLKQLHDMHLRVRHVTLADMEKCLHTLAVNRIVIVKTINGAEKYSLNEEHRACFEDYSLNFLSLRNSLREHLRSQITAIS